MNNAISTIFAYTPGYFEKKCPTPWAYYYTTFIDRS